MVEYCLFFKRYQNTKIAVLPEEKNIFFEWQFLAASSV